jgi:PEP-CTERM motif
MLIGVGFSAPPAEAAFVATIEQDGPNVILAGSGTIDLASLSLWGQGDGILAGIAPVFPEIAMATGIVSYYAAKSFTAPANFGSGQGSIPRSSSGDAVSIQPNGFIFVPEGYVSGSALSDSSTYEFTSLVSLGVTPGVYTWTWGSGAEADSFTLIAGNVPEPSTWAMMLLGFAGLGFAGYRRSRRAATAA